jgi:peroxiredoxin
MKNLSKCCAFVLIALVGILGGNEITYGQTVSGKGEPVFSLRDTKGRTYDLSQVKTHPMILYFFNAESRPSQEGIISLNRLAGQHKAAGLTVWAITLSATEKVAQFVSSAGLIFPVLLDTSRTSDLYQAR